MREGWWRREERPVRVMVWVFWWVRWETREIWVGVWLRVVREVVIRVLRRVELGEVGGGVVSLREWRCGAGSVVAIFVVVFGRVVGGGGCRRRVDYHMQVPIASWGMILVRLCDLHFKQICCRE